MIDTHRKRASVVSIGFMPVGPGVVPDGSFDAPDRFAIGYTYATVLDEIPSAERICLTVFNYFYARSTVSISAPSSIASLEGCSD